MENTIPGLNASIIDVNRKHDSIEKTIKSEVVNNIKYVKYLVASSKSIADILIVAMSFNSTSELVLDAPKSAYYPSVNNEISLKFSVNVSDGLLLFMGNAADKRGKRAVIGDQNGFLAVGVKNKSVQFHYKLNTGEVHTVRNAKLIEKGVLYKVSVKRYVYIYIECKHTTGSPIQSFNICFYFGPAKAKLRFSYSELIYYLNLISESLCSSRLGICSKTIQSIAPTLDTWCRLV